MQFSQEEIQKIKEQFKTRSPQPLYKVTVLKNDYLFTVCDRKMLAQIEEMQLKNPNMTPTQVDEFWVKKLLVAPSWWNPEEYALLPAGVVPMLAMHMRAKSGFYVPEFSDVSSLYAQPLDELPEPELITDELKTKLKAKSDFPLFTLTSLNTTYVFRPISRGEWRTVNAPGVDIEFEVCKKCVVWPSEIDWDETAAGVTRTLVNAIMEISGFAAPQEEAEEL